MIVEICLAAALAGAADPAAGRDEARREIELTKTLFATREEGTALAARLYELAVRAFADGRYGDAIEFARRARVSATRQAASPDFTASDPSPPLIETLLDAITRLHAARSSGYDTAALAPIRELVETAEISLYRGDVTRADQLARRAVELAASLRRPQPPVPAAGDPDASIDLNAAGESELLGAPEMTRALVANILWFRQHIGPFLSVAELRFVPGFAREYVERHGSRFRVSK